VEVGGRRHALAALRPVNRNSTHFTGGGGNPESLWTGAESPPPLTTVEPVSSRYTDWATTPSLTSCHPLFSITHFSNHSPGSWNRNWNITYEISVSSACFSCQFILMPHTSNVRRIDVHSAQEVYQLLTIGNVVYRIGETDCFFCVLC